MRTLVYTETLEFAGEECFDYASPLKALAKWLKKNPECVLLTVGVTVSPEDLVEIIATVERA